MKALRSSPLPPPLYYLLTGLIVVLPALINGAPMVFSDSGSYLYASRSLTPPMDRSIGYPLIIRAVTWQSTLWTVVLFQGMVTSWLVRRCMQTLFPQLGRAWRPHVVMLTLLLAIGSLPWYASQLMPDVLAGLLALCMFLLLFGRDLPKWEVGLLWVLLFFFGLSHYSHLAMLFLIVLGLAILRPWKGLPARLRGRTWRAMAGLAIVPVLGILFQVNYNACHGFGRVLSPTSSLFLAGKLIESGAMQVYLERRCATSPNFLCEHMHELNTTAMYYVWDEKAPTRAGLEMTEASRRLDPVVHDLLSSPDMWPFLAWTSSVSTVVQFAQVNIGSGLAPYGPDSPPWWPIKEHYPHELPLYANSAQQRRSWGLGYLNALNMWVVLGSGLLALVCWPGRVDGLRLWAFAVLLVGTVMANAAATGALANVYDRLQGRVTWLVVFVAIIMSLQRWPAWRRAFLFPGRV